MAAAATPARSQTYELGKSGNILIRIETNRNERIMNDAHNAKIQSKTLLKPNPDFSSLKRMINTRNGAF